MGLEIVNRKLVTNLRAFCILAFLCSQQSSLKSTFFKQPSLKATAAKKTPTPPPTAPHDDSEPATNDRDKPTQDEADAMDDEADDHVTTESNHVTLNGDIAESVRQNSKQKLADLTFNPVSEP